MKELEISEKIVAACRRLYARNMLASADGNISVRLDDGSILMTPTGVAKAHMDPQNMAQLTIDGTVIRGNPSGERQMHLAVYRRCPKARAVVHAHPPHAIAWSVVEPRVAELPEDVLSEVILAAGRIPIVDYARPGTAAMGEVLKPFLPQTRLMILERHGGLSWGESLDEALNGMERLEHSAQILWLANTLGPLRRLPSEEVQALREIRAGLGEKTL